MAMQRPTSWTLAAALCAVSLVFLAPPRSATAQEIQITGPLAGAPAVRRMRVYREGRFQLKPTVSFSLQDEFSRAIFFGAEANYHFFDWFGIGVAGAGAPVQINTDLTNEIAANGVATDRNRLSLPTASGFDDQIATWNWWLTVQAVFIPLRGKLALFQNFFLDTDFFVTAGFALAGVEERSDVAAGTCDPVEPNLMVPEACFDSQTDRSSRIAPTGTFSVGLSVYANDFFGLTLEYRAMPFAWNTSGFDNRNSNGNADNPDGRIDDSDRTLQFNQLFTIGFTFYLPTEAKRSP
jgi:outer membrane beta-barrel protein